MTNIRHSETYIVLTNHSCIQAVTRRVNNDILWPVRILPVELQPYRALVKCRTKAGLSDIVICLQRRRDFVNKPALVGGKVDKGFD